MAVGWAKHRRGRLSAVPAPKTEKRAHGKGLNFCSTFRRRSFDLSSYQTGFNPAMISTNMDICSGHRDVDSVSFGTQRDSRPATAPQVDRLSTKHAKQYPIAIVRMFCVPTSPYELPDRVRQSPSSTGELRQNITPRLTARARETRRANNAVLNELK